MPPHIEVALYRIAQEAISNIALHAKAEIASICLDFEAKAIKLTIEDDGEGFKSDELLSSASRNPQGSGAAGHDGASKHLAGASR